MKEYKVSILFFKQSLILFGVSIFLFLLTTIYHLGVIGVIVFIRSLFMLKSQYSDFKKYHLFEDEKHFILKRNNEHIFLNKNKFKKTVLKKRFYNDFLFSDGISTLEFRYLKP